ncbi:hypothetical protein JCGZ_05646 [Jatropha curcas]|uniref:Uncharacterized protein n=1 Tax=Jatropha curcas TaxID=180498 RepID=A0A067LIV1_JATCU|nr:hypothetical protein JCGZ_05646 [Jatropha curcas]
MITEILLFVSAILFFTFLLANRRWRQLPPGPLGLPVIGHFHLLGPLLHTSLRDLSSRYGPLFSLKLGSVSCIVASTPDLAKAFLKDNDLAFSCRLNSQAVDHITYNASFAFAPYGQYWKFIKKWTTFELLGSRVIGQFVPVRTKEIHTLLRTIYSKAKIGESVNISQELIKFSNNVICTMVWSIRSSETDGQAELTRSVVREVTQLFGQFNVSDYIWFCKNFDLQGFRKRFEETRRKYDSLVEGIITARQNERNDCKRNGEKYKAKDFLDIILDLMEDENTEIKLTREHIKAMILDFFIAGTDTTAILLEWALAELINNPKVLEKAQDEIQKVVGTHRVVEESDCPNLPYIQAIIKETFRLHPPIPVLSRKSIEDCYVNGYKIPKNTLVFINMWAIARDSKYWEDPFEFKPERFLSNSSNIDLKGQHFQLLPFGTGRRICPGIPLAMQELHATLAAAIQCFDFKVLNPSGAKGHGDRLLDMTERPGLTTPRAEELVCIPVPRIPDVLESLCAGC